MECVAESKCTHLHTVEKNGFVVCTHCGMIVDNVYTLMDRRMYEKEEYIQKKQNGLSYSHTEVQTVMYYSADWKGKLLPPKAFIKFKHLSKVNYQHLATSSERTLGYFNRVLNEILILNPSPSYVRADVLRTVRLCIRNGGFTGTSIPTMAAVIFYSTIKRYGIYHTIGKIIDAVGISRVQFRRGIKYFMKKFGGLIEMNNFQTDMTEYIQNVGLRLNVPAKIISRSILGYTLAKKNGYNVTGKNPYVIAGAIIYYYTKKEKLGLTQRKIANELSITSTSIRNRWKDFSEYGDKIEIF